MADIVEKVFFRGWLKNLSVIGGRSKFLAGGTAKDPASARTTL
jgi:hypothetical protein